MAAAAETELELLDQFQHCQGNLTEIGIVIIIIPHNIAINNLPSGQVVRSARNSTCTISVRAKLEKINYKIIIIITILIQSV